MASQTSLERQQVYLDYRDLFCGSKAKVRKNKVIRSVILKHWALLETPINDSHLKELTPVLKTLLKDHVFESQERARRAFPEVFAKSRPVSHANTSLCKRGLSTDGVAKIKRKKHTDIPKGLPGRVSHGLPIKERKEEIRTPLIWRSIRFPFDAQHRVLSQVQQLLEETCFRFMEKWLPSTLKEHGGTCAAAIELTQSLSLIKMNIKSLPDNCMDAASWALYTEIAPDIAQLRHAAVHRLHLPCDDFLQKLHRSRQFAEIFQHSESLAILQMLHSQVEASIKDLEFKTNMVKQRADYIFSQLSQQREVLLQREYQLRDTVAQKQIELESASGRAFFEAIEALSSNRRSNSTHKHNGAHSFVGIETFVNEGDIESDEEQLQAELE